MDTSEKDTEMVEEWKSMKEAAEELGVKANKLSRLASQGKIKSRLTMRDQRSRQVDLVELRKLFAE